MTEIFAILIFSTCSHTNENLVHNQGLKVVKVHCPAKQVINGHISQPRLLIGNVVELSS